MKRIHLFLSILLAVLLLYSGNSHALLIDFEGLGLSDGNPVGTIGIAHFIADASVQGSGYAFITHTYGNGTGDLPPFNTIGNTFITNIGGLGASQFVKTISIDFSVPVTDLSFYACDIDRAVAIEQLTADIFNSNGITIASRVYTAPLSSSNGDGDVIFFDFGNIGEISKMQISLGSQGNYTDIGFGIDNIEFNSTPVPEPSTFLLLFISISIFSPKIKKTLLN